jgi:hypothetical protein
VWSSGGAVIAELVVCIAAVGFALRALRREIEPTQRAFDVVQREVTEAVDLISRDTGRTRAGRRLLSRPGSVPESR